MEKQGTLKGKSVMRKDIEKTYALGREVSAHISRSPIVRELALLSNQEYSDTTSTQSTLNIIERDHIGILWRAKLANCMPACMYGSIFITLYFVSILDAHKLIVNKYWSLILIAVMVSSIIGLFISLESSLKRSVNQYCDLQFKVKRFLDQIKRHNYSRLKCVSQIVEKIDALCLTIVLYEKLGFEIGSAVSYSDIHGEERKSDMYNLRQYLRDLVYSAEHFGLSDGNLSIYFIKANKTYQDMLESGKLMTDFQI